MDFMDLAMQEAQKAIGQTSPNPAVGAVIEKKGKVVGKGYTQPPGKAHAEIMALRKAKAHAKGAILYVTLEPHGFFGRTAPCTDAIIRAGIKQVVVGMKDPHVRVNGKGIAALKRAGVRVRMEHRVTKKHLIRLLNQPYLKSLKTQRPYITLKAGMSLDGKIATKTGESKWITSQEARKDARLERSHHDAVLVGVGTVRADDPELAAHGAFAKKNLRRIIIDPELKSPLTKKVFRDEHVLVACTDAVSVKKRMRYEKKGLEVVSFGKARVSIPRLLTYLGTQGIQSVFVEGGAGVHGSFADAKAIDQALFYIAPTIIGGDAALSVVGGKGVASLAQIKKPLSVSFRQCGSDVRLHARFAQY